MKPYFSTYPFLKMDLLNPTRFIVENTLAFDGFHGNKTRYLVYLHVLEICKDIPKTSQISSILDHWFMKWKGEGGGGGGGRGLPLWVPKGFVKGGLNICFLIY